MDATDRQLSSEDVLLGTSAGLLVCSIFEDERPLKGAAGSLDWRLRGFLSRFVINGHISGALNEFVYIPIKHQGAIRNLLLVGLGSSASTGEEASTELLRKLAETVAGLKFSNIAISRSSFPFFDEGRVKKALKGVEVEFIQ